MYYGDCEVNKIPRNTLDYSSRGEAFGRAIQHVLVLEDIIAQEEGDSDTLKRISDQVDSLRKERNLYVAANENRRIREKKYFSESEE